VLRPMTSSLPPARCWVARGLWCAFATALLLSGCSEREEPAAATGNTRTPPDISVAAQELLDSASSPDSSAEDRLNRVEALTDAFEEAASQASGKEAKRLAILAADQRLMTDTQRRIGASEKKLQEEGVLNWTNADQDGVLERYIGLIDEHVALTNELRAYLDARFDRLTAEMRGIGYGVIQSKQIAQAAAGGRVFDDVKLYWTLYVDAWKSTRSQFELLIDTRGEWGWDSDNELPLFDLPEHIDRFNAIYDETQRITREQQEAHARILEGMQARVDRAR